MMWLTLQLLDDPGAASSFLPAGDYK